MENVDQNLQDFVETYTETTCELTSSLRVAGLPSLASKSLLVALQLASKEHIVVGRTEAMKTQRKRAAKKAFGTSDLADLSVAPGQAVTIDLPSGVDEFSFKKFKSSCAVNGQIVAVPYDAEKILVVDPASRQASAIDLPAGICPTAEEKFSSSCLVNGHVVAVPYNADKILVVDPAAHQAFAIDLPPGISPDGTEKFCRSCSVNGQVVAVPKDAEKILVVDPASRKAFAIELPEDSRADVYFEPYRSSCVGNGQVALPFDFEKILVVDPASRHAFTRSEPSLNWHRWKNVSGKIVARLGGRGQTLMVDDEASFQALTRCFPYVRRKTLKTIFDSDDYLSSCFVNGQLVSIPEEAEKIFVMDGKTPNSGPLDLDLHTSDVHTSPQFVELVAAMLSFWVYTGNKTPPKMANASFGVHTILQPADLGKPMKIAIVTADLPVGKVLFIVLRGTSGMLDFGNWNLEYDLCKSVDEGEEFLVHSRASRAMLDIIFWKWGFFLRRHLAAAREQGVQRVAFVGHSVGGMYAQVCLWWAWEKIQTGWEFLSSFDLQCITFGAPMVFGGSSKKASQFKDFAKERAVNYIHADDPCPRAWGALNLRDFVTKATMAVHEGLTDPHGSIKGVFAPKVVEEMATKFLERPDFNLMEDLAKKYEHFVPLRVLSSKKELDPWKDFQLTPECFEDHSIVDYVNKLFDAFDPCRPECHVHVQSSEPVFEPWCALLGA